MKLTELCLSCLSFINAVVHDMKDPDDEEEDEDGGAGEQERLLSLDEAQDPMASSIHAIYRHRPPLQQSRQQGTSLSEQREEAVQDLPDLQDQGVPSDNEAGSPDSEDEETRETLRTSEETGLQESSTLSPKSRSTRRPKRPSAFSSTAERREVLADKLKEVFGLAEREEVLAEYQAFLFRSVLLQGYLYITSGHVCFYAYLRAKEVRQPGRAPLCALTESPIGSNHQV
jgi:hypothetical protein